MSNGCTLGHNLLTEGLWLQEDLGWLLGKLSLVCPQPAFVRNQHLDLGTVVVCQETAAAEGKGSDWLHQVTPAQALNWE